MNIINQYNKSVPLIDIPTFIMIGDSNLDGRVTLGATGTKHFPEYATDITNGDKTTVKIFDNVGGTDTFVTLNKTNSQCRQAPTNTHGPEQTFMWELAQYYGVQEIRVIKQGVGSTFAGIPANTSLSWQPTYQQMLDFETVYSNAIAAATLEGVQLNIIAIVSFLGTNDATDAALSVNYETNMTAIINHIRNNIVGSAVPFIITSATEGTTYHSNVISEQLSLVGNVADTYYENIFRFGRGLVHPLISGVFGVGLACADNVLSNVLSQPTIKNKYAFKYSTNASGSYGILTRLLENITDYEIDWGDGNQTTVTTNFSTWNNVYADGTTKEISINTFLPWNFIQLTLNSGGTNIVGDFDLSNVTGLDTFVTSADNLLMTAIIEPIDNYNFPISFPANLLNNADLISGSFDFRRYVPSNTLVFFNALITSFVDTSIGKSYLSEIQIKVNDLMTSIDVSSVTGLATSNQFRFNPELLTFGYIGTTPTAMSNELFLDQNVKLTTITNYENSIYHTYCGYDNNNLTVAQVDAIIDEMWDRCQDTSFYYNAASKRVFLQGNQGYSGVFDGTTDWSGGLPTSPGAKAYDMLNDVTGTYNFTTFQLT